jgi:hypothetical protein
VVLVAMVSLLASRDQASRGLAAVAAARTLTLRLGPWVLAVMVVVALAVFTACPMFLLLLVRLIRVAVVVGRRVIMWALMVVLVSSSSVSPTLTRPCSRVV